jgi:hypothetical protein
MKKILTLGMIAVLFSSCASFHAGSISGSAALGSANFDYIQKGVTGSSSATYILGIGGMEKQKMVDEARVDMLKANPLKANQALANMAVDYKNTIILGTLYRKLTVNVTADIVEFKK